MSLFTRTIVETINQIVNNQAIIANNIANISTPGFKSELESKIILFNKTKDNILQEKYILKNYKNNLHSSLKYTNNPLDYAIKNKNGWFTVKIDPKTVAYTKNGHFKINSQRQLTIQNYPVLGTQGKIIVPINSNITITPFGIIKTANNGIKSYPNQQLKFKNIDINHLIHKKNGFYLLDKNATFISDNNDDVSKIKLLPRTLEDSNVNLEENMIKLISDARKFDIQMKILSMYNENAQTANKLLNLNY